MLELVISVNEHLLPSIKEGLQQMQEQIRNLHDNLTVQPLNETTSAWVIGCLVMAEVHIYPAQGIEIDKVPVDVWVYSHSNGKRIYAGNVTAWRDKMFEVLSSEAMAAEEEGELSA